MQFMQQYAVYIFLTLLICWMLWQRVVAPRLSGVKNLSASTYFAMRNEPHTLVDVRSAGEWAGGHAPDAIHIPLGDIGKRKHEIDANKAVVVICASGNRSAMAATALAKAGLKPVYNFSGGMGAWAGAGLPVRTGKK